MRADEIAKLLAPFLKAPLSPPQLQLVRDYLDLLLRWNERINLTAVRRPEEIITRHFGESFFLARHLFGPEGSRRVADLGSGAGFPGVPIAIYAPHARVNLIESNNKKATFLRELTRTLKLPNVSVFAGRAEDFQRDPAAGVPDVVTLRAVEKFEAAVPVAASLLRAPALDQPTDRRFALLIGAGQEQVARKLAAGFAWAVPIPTPGSAHRILLVGNLIS
jgi:16S rRNA (guanine527-N7)-methyltransferase